MLVNSAQAVNRIQAVSSPLFDWIVNYSSAECTISQNDTHMYDPNLLVSSMSWVSRAKPFMCYNTLRNEKCVSGNKTFKTIKSLTGCLFKNPPKQGLG